MTRSKAGNKSKAAPQLKDSKQQKSKNDGTGSICPPAVKKSSTNSKSVPSNLAMGMKSGVQGSPDALRQRIQSNSATGDIRDLRIAIALLFMLNHYPQLPPSKHTCPHVDDPEKVAKKRLLSLSDEQSLTAAFCFLASTTKDPYRVAALCLEESVEGAFITLRIAANRGDLSRVAAGLRNVLAIMKAAEQGGLFHLHIRGSSFADIELRSSAKHGRPDAGGCCLYESKSHLLSHAIFTCKMGLQLCQGQIQ
jgi:hypothetical protein